MGQRDNFLITSLIIGPSTFSVTLTSPGFVLIFCPQDQHSLIVKYQGLVVKQLTSQTKKTEHEDSDTKDNMEEEEGAESIRKELQEITTSIKDLVLRPRKSSVTEE